MMLRKHYNSLTPKQRQFLRTIHNADRYRLHATYEHEVLTPGRAKSLVNLGYLMFIRSHKRKSGQKVFIYQLTDEAVLELDRLSKAGQYYRVKKNKQEKTAEPKNPKPKTAQKYSKGYYDLTANQKYPLCPKCGRHGELSKSGHCGYLCIHKGEIVEPFKGFPMNSVLDSCMGSLPGYANEDLEARFPILIRIGLTPFNLRVFNFNQVTNVVDQYLEQGRRQYNEVDFVEELADFAHFHQDGRPSSKESNRK